MDRRTTQDRLADRQHPYATMYWTNHLSQGARVSRLQQIVVGASLILALGAAHGDISPEEPPEINAANVAAFFDAALTTQAHEHEIVGAIVSVVKDGELLFKRGYGFADLEARKPADPDRSLFRVASVTKTFIWTAIMQLREAGQLDLEADINDYLDFDIPATYEEPIRIWHLMTHTAGFEERAIGMSARDLESLPSLREYLLTLMPQRVWAPGLHAGYSNYSSALAGYIVQQVSGQPWNDYIDERILAPLNMASTNTHVSMPVELLKRHAASYKYSGGRFIRMDLQYMKATPAGIISTTADDMSRFMIAHLNGGSYGGEQILEEESVHKLQSPLFAPVAGLPPMLHGFFADDQNGQFIVGHSGDINQFHSAVRLLPEHNLGVFVSFNSDPAARARSNLFPAFLDHFFPVEYLTETEAAKGINVAEYAGEYVRLRTNRSGIERLGILINSLNVSVVDDELAFSDGRNQERFVPTGPDRFRRKYGDQPAVFQRADSGKITHLLIGTPMGSLARVHGLDAPSNIRGLLVAMVFVAVASILGYGYRLIARGAGQARALPRLHTGVAWLFALLTVVLYVHLGMVLSSDVNDFQFGIPAVVNINLLLMNINAFLALAVIVFSGRQWLSATGGVPARLRYSAVAIAASISLWMGYYFNFIDHLFP